MHAIETRPRPSISAFPIPGVVTLPDDVDECFGAADPLEPEGSLAGATFLGPVDTCTNATTVRDPLMNWMTGVQRRDEVGLRMLHLHCQRRVCSTAMVIVRRSDIANEVVSSTFLQAWNDAASFDPGRGTVLAWLLMIARSRAIDAIRRVQLRSRREVSLDDEVAAEAPWTAESEDVALERCQSRSRALHRGLMRLSPIQRQVLSLTVVRGLSQDEASSWLGLPLGTVKSHARRGLAALRQHCEAMGVTA